LFLLCLLCVAIAEPARAGDRAAVPLYARALAQFNPSLGPSDAHELAQTTLEAADREGLDARLLVALIAVESSWHPDAVSPAGARGLGQLMPATARALGVDPTDPFANIAGAARYLRCLADRFAELDPERRAIWTIAAYNAGPGAVERYGGIPPYPQTRAYVREVVRLWRRLAGRPASRPQREPAAGEPEGPADAR
jgi:soluble lytic murein transglycosylase-like protein